MKEWMRGLWTGILTVVGAILLLIVVVIGALVLYDAPEKTRNMVALGTMAVCFVGGAVLLIKGGKKA